ncbi:CocE/NonD family hydrolase [Streptomyces sp. NPDC059849]|uniref:CocE/NonD family hydrolase n=1 Tax=Streptomyces sp. NPDC059849 TaxID=3346969 RepID=UPI0036639A83
MDDTPRPALIAMSAYGKELQALALTTPLQRWPSPMWDGCIEAGDIARVVREGYAHVIGDMRGTGDSDGVMIGNYNSGGVPQGQDLHDLIERVAEQPWRRQCRNDRHLLLRLHAGARRRRASRTASSGSAS